MMPSTFLFISGTLLLSLNFVRPFGFAISDWLYFGAVVSALLETAFLQRSKFICWTRNIFIWPALLIFFGAIISLKNSLIPSNALVELFQLFYVITLFISVIWIMVKRGKARLIVYAFIFSGVFTALIAIIDFSFGTKYGDALSGTPNSIYVQFLGRYSGTLGHPNKLGYYLVLTTIFSLFQLIQFKVGRKTVRARLFWLALLLIQVFGIYLSGSVTAYLGIGLGFALFLLLSKRITRRVFVMIRMIVAIGILMLIVGIVLGKVDWSAKTSLGQSLIASGIDRVQSVTADSRLVIYKQALAQIIRNPFVGAGFDQLSTSGNGIADRVLPDGIHNPTLQILYAGGLFSFIGWLFIHIYVGIIAVRKLLQARLKNLPPFFVGAAVATLSILLMDQFQDSIYEREKWLVIGLLVGYAWYKSRVSNAHSHLKAG